MKKCNLKKEDKQTEIRKEMLKINGGILTFLMFEQKSIWIGQHLMQQIGGPVGDLYKMKDFYSQKGDIPG